MKCLVKYCPNRSADGRFEGLTCTPCTRALQGESDMYNYAASRILASIWPLPGLQASWDGPYACHTCCPLPPAKPCACEEFCQCVHSKEVAP
jgi:hypothetical protein